MNKAIFESIYNNSVWGSEGGGSGAGSDGTYAIGANYILHLVIYKYGLTSLLDAPCGAVSNSWTKPLITSLASEIPCFKYFGVDVVPSVIALNSAAFSSMDWANFGEVDLSSSDVEIPNGYDIILSRDALQHLPYQYIASAFKTYCRTDSKYLLVGSYIESNDKNKDIVHAGGCFDINLLAAPFNLSNPIEVFAERGNYKNLEDAAYPTKYLLLYELQTFCSSNAMKTFQLHYS
jgi:hypothetical protein